MFFYVKTITITLYRITNILYTKKVHPIENNKRI